MKEDSEWIHSWCVSANKNDLPRVLLIGDSITNGYSEIVRNTLKDICYIDHLVLSYPIDRDIYQTIVSSFENDSNYDLIHFNNGLHDFNMPIDTYKKSVEQILSSFKCKNIIIASSTRVNKENSNEAHLERLNVLKERNAFLKEYSLKHNLMFNDLFLLSSSIELKDRLNDGVHFQISGYEILANQVIKFIKKNLKISG